MYFIPSFYDGIRADPMSIVAAYNAYGAQFAIDAGLTGMNDEIKISAFCAVVAYGMAPYGSIETGLDITSILAAPVLSCDQYVTLTWSFIEEFGTQHTIFQEALGWDGGAVGNHAQLLVSAGGQSALLDPTIGLVVPNVTLSGLVGGVHYTTMQSFWDPGHSPTIPTFNATVQNAIYNGQYEIKDAVFRFLGLDHWQSQTRSDWGLTLGNVRVGYLDDDSFTWEGISYGGKGNDTINGGPTNDYIFGGLGNDVLSGNGGLDTLIGEDGNDWLYGGPFQYGGAGNDVGVGTNGSDIFVMGTGNDAAFGGAGQDYFYMGDGNDTMFGGDGVDVLLGEAGNDYLDGGAGVNYYFGGDGNNTFVSNHVPSVQVVQDWNAGTDVLQLNGSGFTSFADVLSHSYQNGAYFVVQVNSDTAVWLNGATAGTLTAANFSIVS